MGTNTIDPDETAAHYELFIIQLLLCLALYRLKCQQLYLFSISLESDLGLNGLL